MQRFVAAALVRLGIVGAGAAGWGILPFLLRILLGNLLIAWRGGDVGRREPAGAGARAGSAGRNGAMTRVDGVTRR